MVIQHPALTEHGTSPGMSIISFALIQMSERVMQVRRSTAALAKQHAGRTPQGRHELHRMQHPTPSDDDDESLGDDDDFQPSEEVDRTANESSKMEDVDGG